MSVEYDHAYGPYTAADLHDLPDDGKGFELVDGWLIELSPGAPHNLVVDALHWVLKLAAHSTKADLYIAIEPDITTPNGVRRPDVAIIDGGAARTAAQLGQSTFYGPDVLLAAEVVSRHSASERQDRVRKLTEYAKTGIDQYWIVDFDPEVRIQVHVLDGDSYRLERVVAGGDSMQIDEPLAVSFNVADLATWRGKKI